MRSKTLIESGTVRTRRGPGRTGPGQRGWRSNAPSGWPRRRAETGISRQTCCSGPTTCSAFSGWSRGRSSRPPSDFGTRFGSFTYLKTLPITYLKIDVDFVRDLARSEANQHLVRAIVGLAGDFGYETIAEGVEDAEAMAILKRFGVDFAQGNYLGAPAPEI